MRKLLQLIVFIAAVALISGCAVLNTNQSLYQRIGGQEVLAKIVSETIDTTANDPRTKRSFEGVKLVKLKESITNQLCQLTGGGCNYEGDTMQKSHADAKISTAEFELMVQNLRDVLDHQHVGTREKNELLKILAPMKRDVVSN